MSNNRNERGVDTSRAEWEKKNADVKWDAKSLASALQKVNGGKKKQ